MHPDNVIKNLFTYSLTKMKEFLLSLDLQFRLAKTIHKFPPFFLPLGRLAHNLSFTPNFDGFNKFISCLFSFSFKNYHKIKSLKFSSFIFKNSDFKILKSLSKNLNLVILDPIKESAWCFLINWITLLTYHLFFLIILNILKFLSS